MGEAARSRIRNVMLIASQRTRCRSEPKYFSSPVTAMNKKDEQTEAFLTLLAEHSGNLYSTILRLVLNHNDADDIYQEMNLVLWREFETFELGTNFRLWASRIAINQVMAWRKRLHRERECLVFSCDFLEAVAEEMNPNGFPIEEEIEALSDCLARLSERHRELIAQRYGTQLDVESIALRQNRTPNAVYRLLQRIRENLFLCIERKSASGNL